MKFRKTPQNQRQTYTYRFDNGDWSVVSVGKVTSFHDGTITVSNDASITKEMISYLHKLDDKEVRENLRAINFEDKPMMKERIAKKKQWNKEHPYEENPYDRPVKVISLNAFTPDATLDMIDNFLYHNLLDEEGKIAEEERIKALVDQVDAYVATFSERRQLIYRYYFKDNLTQEEIAHKLGVSENAVKMTIKKMKKAISKKFSGKKDT